MSNFLLNKFDAVALKLNFSRKRYVYISLFLEANYDCWLALKNQFRNH